MFRPLPAALITCAVLLVGCQPAARPVDPNDPAITAIIDSLVNVSVDGASKVDADRVLQPAGGAGELTFITGDVLLTGLEPIRERFRATYGALQGQHTTITEKRIRVLGPDAAIAFAVGEGTYTDKAGWTSAPVGLGITLVFVKENGQWHLRHAHQSIAP
jgi:uncharacterized protein (TIGR02246 family)